MGSKIIFAVLAIIVILFIGFEIWTAITYGGKPMSEVPFWAFWMFRK